MERYRSGHNEAVLKTVCPQGRVGSNPTLSAGDTSPTNSLIKYDIFTLETREISDFVWRSTQDG